MKPTNRRVATSSARALTAAAAVLLLSSCGGESLSGVAADVDGEVITDEEVDDFASLLCSLSAAQSGDETTGGAATGSRQMRFQSLDLLLGIEVADQIGDLDAVDPAQVDQAVQQAASARDQVPADLQDLYDETVESYAKSQLALVEAGRASLEEQGQTEVDEAAAFGEGDRLRTEYVKSQDVTVDPRFGVIEDGILTYQDGSVSTAVSEFATESDIDIPSPAFTEALPASQVCS